MEWIQRYKNWVRSHGNSLALAETGLSTLTWLLPDRFTDNELSLEAVHTGINLISALHDSVLHDPGAGAPRGAGELTLALSALQQVQVLVELWGLYAQRQGAIESHYDPLIAVEGLKSIVRLAILRASGCRILANGGATTFDPVLGAGGRGGRGTGPEARAREVFAAFAAFREKRCFPPPPPPPPPPNTQPAVKDASGGAAKPGTATTPAPRFWWEEEGPAAAAAAAGAPPRRPNADALRDLERRAAGRQAAAARLIIAGELLHVARPLLYVAALRRWGRRSWKPWALSLALEAASARLSAAGAAASRAAAAAAAADPAVVGTALAPLYGAQGVRWRREEADELARRKLLLLYALLRDPFFSKITGPAVARWRGRLERVPLVGRVADKAAEVLLGAQKYYSYTAAS